MKTMFHVVINHHKKWFNCSPILAAVAGIYFLICLMGRCRSPQMPGLFSSNFFMDILFCYGITFYVIPFFFDCRCNQSHDRKKQDAENLDNSYRYYQRQDDDYSFSTSYDCFSNSNRYDPNRYDVGSPLYESSIGKPI